MILPTLKYESELWKKGCHLVCGVDEVGRGCFAGPVVVGAVVLSKEVVLPEGVADSKLLKPKTREELAIKIKETAVVWAISEVSVEHINKLGIGKATQMAFLQAVQNLKVAPDHILIDAFYNLSKAKISSSAYIENLDKKVQTPVIKGDQKCASVAAASIIAKVYRDHLMVKLHQKYPQYGFDVHKGYGTKIHQEAIKKHGLCELHRKSFNLDKFLPKLKHV